VALGLDSQNHHMISTMAAMPPRVTKILMV
jgi:hypothetical protein